MAKCTGKCPITFKLPIACCNFKALFFSEFKEVLYGYYYSAEQSTFISVFCFTINLIILIIVIIIVIILK